MGSGLFPAAARATAFVVGSTVLAACGTKATSPSPKPAPARHFVPVAPGAPVKTTVAPWSLPAALSRPAAASDGPNLVLMGGIRVDGSSSSSVRLIDPTTGQVLAMGQLPLPTHDAGAAVLGSKAYLFGGGSSYVYSSVQAWTDSSGGVIAAHLPAPRADCTVASSPRGAFIVGGYSGSAMDASVLATKNGTTFRTVSTLPIPVRYGAAATMGHYLYVLGGETASGSPTSAVQAVNLSTGASAVVGHMAAPLDHAQAAILHGRILVVGGRIGGRYSRAIWSLDPANGSVTRVGSLVVPVSDEALVSWGGSLWSLGGQNPQPSAIVQRITDVTR